MKGSGFKCKLGSEAIVMCAWVIAGRALLERISVWLVRLFSQSSHIVTRVLLTSNRHGFVGQAE